MICYLWSRWQLLSTEESASWKLFWLQERLSVHHFSRHVGSCFLDSPTTLINFVADSFGQERMRKEKGRDVKRQSVGLGWPGDLWHDEMHLSEVPWASGWKAERSCPDCVPMQIHFVLRKSDCHDWQARTGLWQRIPCACSSFWWMSFFHCQAWSGKGAGGTNGDVWGPESWRPMWLYLAGWMDPAAIAQHFGFALGAKVWLCDVF